MRPLFALLFLVPLPAAAAQVVSPAVFEGDYALDCTKASLDLHVAVGAATATGSGSWDGTATFPLACAIAPSDLAAEVDAIESGCVGAGLPASACAQAADDLYASLLPLTTLGTTILPTSMAVDIGTGDWWGQVFGVYPAWFTYRYEDGRSERTYHLFDNTAGWTEGHFVSIGLGLQGVGASSQGGCVASAVAAIDGRILRLSGFSATGSLGIDQSLTCLASDGAVLVGLNAGLSFSATMSGHKVK
ncbi:MAG: hypothetical protein H6733_14310 [Alphaproteobacteria bacterium]|nr:hypothetical protein [Alphaproteobacteria bacterium]